MQRYQKYNSHDDAYVAARRGYEAACVLYGKDKCTITTDQKTKIKTVVRPDLFEGQVTLEYAW